MASQLIGDIEFYIANGAMSAGQAWWAVDWTSDTEPAVKYPIYHDRKERNIRANHLFNKRKWESLRSAIGSTTTLKKIDIAESVTFGYGKATDSTPLQTSTYTIHYSEYDPEDGVTAVSSDAHEVWHECYLTHKHHHNTLVQYEGYPRLFCLTPDGVDTETAAIFETAGGTRTTIISVSFTSYRSAYLYTIPTNNEYIKFSGGMGDRRYCQLETRCAPEGSIYIMWINRRGVPDFLMFQYEETVDYDFEHYTPFGGAGSVQDMASRVTAETEITIHAEGLEEQEYYAARYIPRSGLVYEVGKDGSLTEVVVDGATSWRSDAGTYTLELTIHKQLQYTGYIC